MMRRGTKTSAKKATFTA